MQSLYALPIACLRFVGLFGLLAIMWVDSILHTPHTVLERAHWQQKWAHHVLRFLHCRVEMRGTVPPRGLIASNHISYVDVLVLASLRPCVFVAKSEVRKWPLIGMLCARCGVLFLDRSSMRAAAAANRTIAEALRTGMTVVVFPEGTTSAGDTMLPLHAALFQSALDTKEPIIPAWITYNEEHRERVAYYGDATLMSHLLQLMRTREMQATVQFRTTGVPALHRTQAAEMCRTAWEMMLDRASGRRQEIAAA
jgi:1-acyl-sn-glycerol-3-phosphate acyltransferase